MYVCLLCVCISVCFVYLLPTGVAEQKVERRSKAHAATHGCVSHCTQKQLEFLPGLLESCWPRTGPVCWNNGASWIGLLHRYTFSVPTMHASATVLSFCGQTMEFLHMTVNSLHHVSRSLPQVYLHSRGIV